MKSAILFDLDGTLLPMDQEVFTAAYFRELCSAFSGLYDPQELVRGVWQGTRAMTLNQGPSSNYEVFWRTFSSLFGEDVYERISLFDEFYTGRFERAKSVCGFQPRAGKLIRRLKETGRRLILASNPVFPLSAQKARLRWAGVNAEDFEYLTSYENSHFCKPNPAYYTEILQKQKLEPADCLMIGNDAVEDLAAREAGISIFLLTDCLLNGDKCDFKEVPNGNWNELEAALGK